MGSSASAVTFTSPLRELHISHLRFVHDQRQVGMEEIGDISPAWQQLLISKGNQTCV